MWYEKLDFDENPFEDSDDITLVGYNDIIDEMLYSIDAGNILFIEGKQGSGKTAILKRAISKYKGQGKVVYIDCEKVKDLNMEDVLMDRHGFWSKLLKKMPKNMIVLMDDIKNISKKNNERLKYFYDQNYIKAIIFTNDSFSNINFSDSLKDRIKKVIKIKSLTEEDAVTIIEDRLRDKEILPEEIVKEVFKRSNKNIKEFLANCEKICEKVVESGEKVATKEHLKEIFGEEEKEKKVKPKKKVEKEEAKAEEAAEESVEDDKVKVIYEDVAERYY